jgi:hypothetical protein
MLLVLMLPENMLLFLVSCYDCTRSAMSKQQPNVRHVFKGRSNIVGVPIALMLLKRNATVTICHSKTVDIQAEVCVVLLRPIRLYFKCCQYNNVFLL